MSMIELNVTTQDEREASLCRDYWRLRDDGRFDFTVAQLAHKYTIVASKIAARVAAACTAWVLEDSCGCGCPRFLRTRSQYEPSSRSSRRYGYAPWVCDECQASQLRLAQKDAKRRAETQVLILQREVNQQALTGVLTKRLSLIETIYLVTLMRAGGSDDLSFIGPRNSFTTLLSPTAAFDRTIYSDLSKAGLVCTHPQTAAGSVVIEGDRLVSVDMHSASWVLTLPEEGPSPAEFLESLESTLRSGDWPEGWRAEAATLALDVALQECLRYVEIVLKRHHWPAQPGEKMRLVLRSALQFFSVSQVYNFIFNAAKNAASFLVQKHAHKAHAANTIPGSIQRQAENARASKRDVYAYRRDFETPESQLSQVLFTLALGLPNGGFDSVLPVHTSRAAPDSAAPQPTLL